MKRFLMVCLLSFALVILTGFVGVDAKVYLIDDFEDFPAGGAIPGNSEFWIHNNTNASLDASITGEISHPPGGRSILFENPLGGTWPEVQSIGLNFANLNLPGEYVFSCYYWHNSKDMPPPDFMACLVGGFGWLGLGTRGEDVHGAGGGIAEDITQYVYRDKAGDSLYHSSDITRRSEWVNLAFIVSREGTDCLIDGEVVYSSDVNSSTATEFYMGTMWEAPKNPVFIDHVMITDTLEEAELKVAVESSRKLASVWGHIRSID